MSSGNSQRLLLPAMLACCAAVVVVWVSVAVADPSSGGASGPQAPLRVAERSDLVPPRGIPAALPNEHPLMPVLRWATAGLAQMQANVHDYSATMVKRERVGGKLNDYEYLFMKVRQKPFSVYLYFLGPPSLKGREVIYVDGQNNGSLVAHTTGVQDTLVGTVMLKPDGMIAMQGERYPLTEIGLVNLTRRLIEVGQKDVSYGECEVKFFPGARINNRVCTCIQVTHPVPRRNFLFHVARIFVDEQLNIPVRYESYDWPKERGAAPDLLEEYTYLNLKINQGFTDTDFDRHNPNYRFL
jgi:outer membrane lipoprotein-sorting protein